MEGKIRASRHASPWRCFNHVGKSDRKISQITNGIDRIRDWDENTRRCREHAWYGNRSPTSSGWSAHTVSVHPPN